jgi:hypothetical protein
MFIHFLDRVNGRCAPAAHPARQFRPDNLVCVADLPVLHENYDDFGQFSQETCITGA